jgi:hypothetical protein
MLSNLEEKVTQCLVAADRTMPQLAEEMGLTEPALLALFQVGDLRLSELLQLARYLSVPAAYFLPTITQGGAFNQAGNGNIQKIKIGKAAAHQLASQLSICQSALHSANELVAAKDEIITLLRASYTRSN